MDNWKQRVYDSYLSNNYEDLHSGKKEYELQRKYFKKNYLKYMPKDKNCKILELGCGMGQFYYFVRSEGFINYEAIDASKENISYIKKVFGNEINVKVDDIINFLQNRISDKMEGYDVVIMNDVIEHFTKPEIFEILDYVNKVLNENGVFMIKTNNMTNPYVNTAGRYIDITHEVCFTEHSMRQVLIATGYKNINIVGTDI